MKKEIEAKLQKFLDGFEHKADVVGVLVCGSYVTGHPNSHSDLDVHLLLNKKCKYRERGNRIVDGLLIEYFANTKRQILAYFDEDFKKLRAMSQTQFATGEIIFDKTGEIAQLKQEAEKQLERGLADVDVTPSSITLYALWDSMDDLQAIFEEGRADFDFVYYCKLDRLLSVVFHNMHLPFNVKTAYGQLVDKTVRKKYLLKEITDKPLCRLIKTAIAEVDKKKRLDAFCKLTQQILDENNFDISKFSFNNAEEV